MTTYNRYVRMDNGDYARIPMEEPIEPRRSPVPPPPKIAEQAPPPPIAQQKPKTQQVHRPIEARAANRLLEHFHMGDIDSGDLLLLSVLFFLFKQNADEELLIALGLLLIL